MPPPTEAEFQEFEKLLEEGHSPYVASRRMGTTLSHLKHPGGDRVRYEQLVERSGDIRAAVVDERIDDLVQKDDPHASIVIKWATANHPAYRDKTQIEISGTINHEAKVLVLGDVLDVIDGTGVDLGLPAADARPRAALPSAEAVRAASAESAAGSLPAGAES
jgi:hypothetical protein